MEKYKDPSAPIEERISDLMSRMTVEEMIMQTDQYFSNDFTELDASGDVTYVDMKQLDSLLHGCSAGSIQPCHGSDPRSQVRTRRGILWRRYFSVRRICTGNGHRDAERQSGGF